MRFIFIVVFFFFVALFTTVQIRKTDYWRERQTKIREWFCGASGGTLTKDQVWEFNCEFIIDKRGKIIRP